MFDNIFHDIFLFGLVVGSAIRKIYARRHKKSEVRKDYKAAVDTLLIAFASLGFILPILYLFTDWLDFADYRMPFFLGWVGAAVFAGALWLLWRSHVDLGRNFSPLPHIREERKLIARGVYGRIRHPYVRGALALGRRTDPAVVELDRGTEFAVLFHSSVFRKGLSRI